MFIKKIKIKIHGVRTRTAKRLDVGPGGGGGGACRKIPSSGLDKLAMRPNVMKSRVAHILPQCQALPRAPFFAGVKCYFPDRDPSHFLAPHLFTLSLEFVPKAGDAIFKFDL